MEVSLDSVEKDTGSVGEVVELQPLRSSARRAVIDDHSSGRATFKLPV